MSLKLSSVCQATLTAITTLVDGTHTAKAGNYCKDMKNEAQRKESPMAWLGRSDKVLFGTLSHSFIQHLGEAVGKDKF